MGDNHEEGGDGDHEAEPDEGKARVAPRIPATGGNKNRREDAAEAHRKPKGSGNRRHDSYEWTALIFSGLALAAAIVAAGAAFWLGIETRDIVRDTRRAADTAHSDLVNSENLAAFSAGTQQEQTWAALGKADKANGISRDTAYRELRAYVSFGLPNMSADTATGNIQMTIDVTNSGNTPTVGLREVVGSKINPAEMDPWDESAVDNKLRTMGALGPKQTSPANAGVIAIPLFMARTGQHLYVFGRAKYGDTVRPGARHQTDFCYDVIVPTALPAKAKISACADPRRNCADDECKAHNAAFNPTASRR